MMKICKQCGKQFKARTVICLYCSISCFRIHSRKEQKLIACIICKKPIIHPKGEHRKYCSNKCQGEHTFNQKVEKTLKNERLDHHHGLTSRKIAFVIFGRQCCICDSKTWMGQEVPLILDHVDGNPEDWSLKNLRLICPNCDAQTPTYTGRNRGHGRLARRLEYMKLKKRLRGIAQSVEQMPDKH